MNLDGFSVTDYARLIESGLASGWTFLTVREYLEADALPEHFVVLRHDVDRKVANALALARVEAARGVAATYYFRMSTFDPDVAREFEEMGHEVGYHYEDLAATGGDRPAAERRFAENLADFREAATVRTVCAHGNAFSSQYNPDLWEGRLDELSEYGILGEAYLSMEIGPDSDVYYLSDTNRTWETPLIDFGIDASTSDLLAVPGVDAVDSTDDLIAALESCPCRGLYVLAHPSRWSRSRGEYAQSVAWDVSAQVATSVIGRVQSLIS